MARILVIDDDPDIADLIGLRMTLDGHQVDLVHDGAAGLQRAIDWGPDVLIVDWTLPGLTGPEVCHGLREQLPDESAPLVLMLTGRPLTADERAQAGADEVLAKPFSPRDLSHRVSAALERARQS